MPRPSPENVNSIRGLVLLVVLWLVLGNGCTRGGGRPFRQPLPLSTMTTPQAVIPEPQPVHGGPELKSIESNWAYESENFSARAPGVTPHWSFAVIAHRARFDTDLAVLHRHLRLALDLGPRFLVLVSDIAVTPDGRFCHEDQVADFGPDSIPVPVFLSPGSYGRSHFTIPCAPFGTIIYTTLATDTASSPSGSWELPGFAGESGEQQRAFVIVDREPGTVLQSSAWQNVLARCRLTQRKPFILVIGGEAFSWQRDAGVDVLTVPWLRTDDDIGEAVLEGRFSGIVWGTLNDAGVSLRVVRDSGVMQLAFVAQEFQHERLGLRDTFTASQMWDANAVTTVACRNVTSSPLHFAAHWEFGCDGVSVDPLILGFDLAPSEAFRQEFRFASPDGVLLRQAAPVFVCRTELAGPEGRLAPLTVRVAPQCTVSGTMVTLPGDFAADGELREWSGSPYTLGRFDQSSQGNGRRLTPDDAAGSVFVGVRGDTVCVAVSITDDHWLTSPVPGDEVTIRCSAEGTGLFEVVLDGEGKHRSTDERGTVLGVVGVQFAQPRMNAEICLPEGLTRRARAAGALQVEVTFRDRDPEDSGEVVLVLSGGSEEVDDQPSYARFFFPGGNERRER